MAITQPVRYCDRCGGRLARDNTDTRCSACRSTRDMLLGPPAVSREFWDTDQMRDALATWHMGRVIFAYRTHRANAGPCCLFQTGWPVAGCRAAAALPNRPMSSLISSLIHLRTPASIGVHRRSLSRQRDYLGQPWTVILNTEADAQSVRDEPDPTRSQSDQPNRPVASWQVEPQGVAHQSRSPGRRPKRFAFLEHLRVLEISRQVIDRVG